MITQIANLAGYIIEYDSDKWEGGKYSQYWIPGRLTQFEIGSQELVEYLNKRRFTVDEAIKLCKLIREFMVKF